MQFNNKRLQVLYDEGIVFYWKYLALGIATIENNSHLLISVGSYGGYLEFFGYESYLSMEEDFKKLKEILS